ncbi:DUF3581 family protein [Rheinheimera salexigens]|uniref:DUF3581 domain-containing protein n=1 Tax=Rheinheimera salexigens TaxID=1628148 RepID=A0A1E7Q6T1_9GAMM|nr:DUF3581 family protein [Rheinheimera salexigens]OEY69837.1 hypothetical protein BI198_09895 [Rheinheimera salexigens]
MLIDQYVTQTESGFSFSRKQSSEFAKKVATDFNPLHDEDAKRFCVPGDLMFSYLLTKYGISEQMTCHFSGMVAADTLLCTKQENNVRTVIDQQGKPYLSITRNGAVFDDPAIIDPLIKDYVRFSGQNFPYILQPLMQKHQVMINPARPLVIYESMSLQFSQLPQQKVELQLSNSTLTVEGKRGNVILEFCLVSAGVVIGKGEKRMILSNLTPYNDEQMQLMVKEYNNRKAAA